MTTDTDRWVIRVIEAADGRKSEYDGQYVRTFDPDYGGGLGRVWTTEKIEDAILYKTFAEAAEAWKAQSKVRPLRPDGKPNRPMTAFTVEIFRVKLQ